MLNFEEFKSALTEESGPHWINAYVDQEGIFWVQRNGGLGTSIFMQLETDHPYASYIEELLKECLLGQEEFENQYEAGGEKLAQLLPKISSCRPRED